METNDSGVPGVVSAAPIDRSQITSLSFVLPLDSLTVALPL